MPTLVMALYAEGRSDERFLPIIIQRTAVRLLSEHAAHDVDVSEPIVVNPATRNTRNEAILDVAQQAHGYHLLTVHADADDVTPLRAMRERITPGFQAVAAAQRAGQQVCGKLTAIVPVQMTEAWMLADSDALRNIIGAMQTAQHLNLPVRPALVEGIADPKARIREVLAMVQAERTRRRRTQRKIADLYEPLARRIDLNRLYLAPSFARFQDDLQSALVDLGFIEP